MIGTAGASVVVYEKQGCETWAFVICARHAISSCSAGVLGYGTWLPCWMYSILKSSETDA